MSFQPKDFLVWGEVPVSDLDKAIAFYSRVTGAELTMDESGPNPVAMFQPKDPKTGIALHLYPGTPASDGRGPTLHLAAEGTLAEVMDRVFQAGGRVTSEIIEIPPGRFFYATDPDGNSLGFFKANSD
ncbi:VOC family protein [Ruegeria sp. 2012CJ41-6]|uniref:VOC family protein n=1 Tax=Ruegeria spongiae TaxID=2942209 RepID=A0ABT0Q303_9RHOB|nr:VOC family protein [Ruegeria spongiae]MCL6284258.1 VOC family protein [Ruegeria spongiae]